MKINKPKFWDKKNQTFFSLMLLPFSYIYFLIITIKKYFKKENSLFQLYVLVIFMLAVLEKHPFVLS